MMPSAEFDSLQVAECTTTADTEQPVVDKYTALRAQEKARCTLHRWSNG